VDGKHIVICDDLASREPREFTWQLQTDKPLENSELERNTQYATRHFENTVGNSRLQLAVIEPAQFVAKNIEHEIVAYPSSSTPEWVLRHPQFTLMLTSERTTATRFVVALDIATPTQVTHIASDAGSALELREADTRIVVAFARDARGIRLAEEIETDARWIVAGFRGEVLAHFSAGEATRVWIGKQLRFASTQPGTCEMAGTTWRVHTNAPDWLSLWSPSACGTIVVNGEAVATSFDAMLALVRVRVPCGEVEISLG